MVVRLKGVLHHADEPTAFLQVPCHILAPQSRTERQLESLVVRREEPTSLPPSVVKGLKLLCLKHPPVRTAPESSPSESPWSGGVGGGREKLYRREAPIKSPRQLRTTPSLLCDAGALGERGQHTNTPADFFRCRFWSGTSRLLVKETTAFFTLPAPFPFSSPRLSSTALLTEGSSRRSGQRRFRAARRVFVYCTKRKQPKRYTARGNKKNQR